MQFGALSRSSFLIARHPQDPTRRVATLGKVNYVRDSDQTSLSFTIANHLFTVNEHLFDVGRVIDLEHEDVSIEDVLKTGSRARTQARDLRREAVRDALTAEPQSVREVAKAATNVYGDEVSKSTAQRLLDDLYIAGQAEQVDKGWVASQASVPLLRVWDSGTAGLRSLRGGAHGRAGGADLHRLPEPRAGMSYRCAGTTAKAGRARARRLWWRGYCSRTCVLRRVAVVTGARARSVSEYPSTMPVPATIRGERPPRRRARRKTRAGASSSL